MTLGTWFREYVYIPLGGNRKGTIRQIFNLLVVWFLTGLWHGAGWNFILWGLYFFVLLLVEKLFLLREMGRWPKIFRHIYALFFIVLGWAVFACDDMSVLFSYLQSMFGVNVAVDNGIAAYYWQSYGWLLLILVDRKHTASEKGSAERVYMALHRNGAEISGRRRAFGVRASCGRACSAASDQCGTPCQWKLQSIFIFSFLTQVILGRTEVISG